MIEASGESEGYAWLAALFVAISAMAAAATLRAGAQIFLGCGPRGEDPSSTEGEEDQPESEKTTVIPAIMHLPAAVLLALALVLGLIPGVSDAAEHAAAIFENQKGYVAAVLHGASSVAPLGPLPPAGPTMSDFLTGFYAVGAALLLSALLLARPMASERAQRRMESLTSGPISFLRAIHSGDVRDYVAWLMAGLASLAAALFSQIS